VVTFLFTDIEGSTRRWEADAQSMRAALAAHDEVLGTVIEAHDGFVFSHAGEPAATGHQPGWPRAEVVEIPSTVRSRRLVTLTGVGGVGKTRLAVEIALRLAHEYPDGVWVFELSAVTDPAAVPDAVAAVLGTVQQSGKSVSESVAAALEGRVRLLVFDNCEHVLDAVADLMAGILAQSTSMKMIATSREGLGVADEQVWPVRSLDVETAADLFADRAHDVAPHVTLDQAAVVDICGRLDGIPLAIERHHGWRR
jgi:predicted ATPase